jgi:hypothetical protein
MSKHLRRILLASVAVSTIAGGVAYAVSGKFHFADATLQTNGDLTVAFKETGLGNTGFSSVTIDVTAKGSVVCQCVNNGGNCPNAANKSSASGLVSGSGSFPVSNGNTTGTITVHPPACAQTSPSCQPPMALEVLQVSYSGIMIQDVTVGDGPIPTDPANIPLTTIATCG